MSKLGKRRKICARFSLDLYSYCPYLISQVASLHDGSYAHTESLTAFTLSAPIRHSRVGSPSLYVC
ncbi:MAG: hypothetical protein OXG94_02415, partial [Bacteroidetes bacterium]|nr:hypothetical protein [Bacteroidota bacterium]